MLAHQGDRRRCKDFRPSAHRLGPILLVDDHDDARVSVREALEDAGYAVVEAVHEQQALDLLVTHPDDRAALVILDLQMPVDACLAGAVGAAEPSLETKAGVS
ncbi:MAG TPA: response regulator [Polyangiaceae bacterium]|nr:response regulator [Polyangiaceae bacterium]